jgi:hypothetical protein
LVIIAYKRKDIIKISNYKHIPFYTDNKQRLKVYYK